MPVWRVEGHFSHGAAAWRRCVWCAPQGASVGAQMPRAQCFGVSSRESWTRECILGIPSLVEPRRSCGDAPCAHICRHMCDCRCSSEFMFAKCVCVCAQLLRLVPFRACANLCVLARCGSDAPVHSVPAVILPSLSNLFRPFNDTRIRYWCPHILLLGLGCASAGKRCLLRLVLWSYLCCVASSAALPPSSVSCVVCLSLRCPSLALRALAQSHDLLGVPLRTK